MNIQQKLQMCIDTINEIKDSGYWPFASPAPCSTEVKIKKSINSAEANLQTALYWHEQMFGKTGRNPMECGRSVITEKATDVNAEKQVRVGAKCRWHDPAIADYGSKRKQRLALERVFTIEKIIGTDQEARIAENDIVLISDGHTEAEVPVKELELI